MGAIVVVNWGDVIAVDSVELVVLVVPVVPVVPVVIVDVCVTVVVAVEVVVCCSHSRPFMFNFFFLLHFTLPTF